MENSLHPAAYRCVVVNNHYPRHLPSKFARLREREPGAAGNPGEVMAPLANKNPSYRSLTIQIKLR